MKYLIPVLACLFMINSCAKEEPAGKSCDFQSFISLTSESNTVIPLHSQNFWVYTDSVWENGVFESEKSTLLRVEEAIDLEGLTSIDMTSIIPRLTLRGDTLFSTILTPGEESDNCYELLFPMFFATQDSVVVDTDPSTKIVYRSPLPVSTPVGTFSDNIIYAEEEIFEVIVNEEIGIIRISFFIYDGTNPRVKRRTLTLKDFDLN